MTRQPDLPTLKSAFKIAWPASLAAMITPLLGAVDTAVLARGASTTDITGVALAGAVFSLLYWSLGFLRMGMSGLTAQADGREDEAGVRAHLIQGVSIGGLIGFVLVILSPMIIKVATFAMGAGNNTSDAALSAMQDYIGIRLWAAPFAIAFFGAIGWLTGQGRTGLMMLVVVTVTILNALLDIYFVLVLGMGVEGIALGTALAEACGAVLIGLTVLYTLHQRGGIGIHWDRSRWTENWRGVFALNFDIFVRTFCLASVFAYFTRAGGQFGDLTVAANQVLMYIILTAGLLLDGPAIAAETLVGKAIGARTDRKVKFDIAVETTSLIALAAALLLTLILFISDGPILTLIIPDQEETAQLLAEAERFYIWAAISPIILLAPFQMDGVYIGATRGRSLRNSMILAVILFVIAVWGLRPTLGNHGLWLAFGVFMVARAVFLAIAWRGFHPLIATPER